MQKVLIIGLGGSGGKTLGYLMDELKVRLDDSWGGRMPACWEFMNIDVPANEGVVGGKLARSVKDQGGQYIGLAGSGGSYSTFDHVFIDNLQSLATPALGTAARWRPDPIGGDDVPVASGAGAYRAIGRVITAANSKTISTAIAAAVNRLNSDHAQQDLNKLTDSVNPVDKVFVFLVSSLAGGSGASMVLDVADIVRGLDSTTLDGVHSTAFLYTADVFNSLGISSGGPGSLATISELVGAMSRTAEKWTDKEWGALGVGTSTPQGTGRGPFRIIPVGAKTGTMSFGTTPEDVYRGFARVLAPLFNDRHIQDQFIHHLITNSVDAIKSAGDRTRMTQRTRPPSPAERNVPGHFAGMGSAKLSMGRDRYIEYSAQTIARAALEVLINGHVNDDLLNKKITLAQAITAGVEDVYSQFKSIAKLTFLDSGSSEIARSLSLAVLPEGARREFASSRAQEIRGLVLGAKLSGETAAGKFDRYLVGSMEVLRRNAREAGLRAISEWVSTTSKSLEEAYIYAASVRGVMVANEALKRVSAELLDASVALSNSLGSAPAAFEDKWRIETLKLLRAAGNAEISPALTTKFVGELSNQLARLVSQEAAKSISAVISGFEREFVQPIISDSIGKLEELNYQFTNAMPTAMSAAFREAPCAVWPLADSAEVPAHFEPAINEVLVEGVDRFPQHFHTHLGQATGKAGVREAARQIISGWETTAAGNALKSVAGWDWQPTSLGSHFMINRQRNWEPSELTVVSGRTSGALKTDLQFTEQAMLANARTWVNLAGSAFKFYEQQGILEWLQPETPLSSQEAKSREDIMASKFAEAVQKARPLVEIDETLVGTIHGMAAVGVDYEFSTVPLPSNHDVVRKVVGSWTSGGDIVNQRALTGSCTVTPHLGEIVIMGLTRGWYLPMCFTSLTKPIRDQWTEAVRDQKTESFWTWRRARSLREFVPFSKFHIQEFLQGWIIGRISGAIRLVPTDDGSGSMRVVVNDLTENVERSFDVHQLSGARLGVRSDSRGQDESNWNVPAALLEHFALAMFKCQGNDLSPLAPYRAVMDLGAGVKASAIMDFDIGGANPDIASVLDRWYQNPAFLGRASQIKSAAEGTAAERVAATQSWLNQVIERMNGLESQVLTPGLLKQLDREYEIAPEIAAACRMVLAELSRDDLGAIEYQTVSAPITTAPIETESLNLLPEVEG